MAGLVPTDNLRGGDTWSRVFTFKRNGVLINFVAEGWSGWRAQWRSAAGSAAMIPFAVDDSQANAGAIRLSLTSQQTEQMGGPGVWDLEATQAAQGVVQTWLQGDFTWAQDVTR